MRTLSATCLAIALADKVGTLRLVERVSRFGLGDYIAIEDANGVIETALTRKEAENRLADIRSRAQ